MILLSASPASRQRPRISFYFVRKQTGINELDRSTVDLLVRSTDMRKKQSHLLLDWTLLNQINPDFICSKPGKMKHVKSRGSIFPQGYRWPYGINSMLFQTVSLR